MAAQAVCPHPCLKAPLRSSPETTSCPGREGQSPPQRQSTEGSTLKVPFCKEAFVQLRLSHDGNAGDVLPLPRCSIPGTEKWVAWWLRQWASNHGAREARAAPPHGLGEPDVPHLHQPRPTAGPRLSSTVALGRACQQRDEGSGQAGAFPSLSPDPGLCLPAPGKPERPQRLPSPALGLLNSVRAAAPHFCRAAFFPDAGASA